MGRMGHTPASSGSGPAEKPGEGGKNLSLEQDKAQPGNSAYTFPSTPTQLVQSAHPVGQV